MDSRSGRVSACGIINTVAGGGSLDLLASDSDTAIATNAQLKLAIPGLAVQSGIATDSDGNLLQAGGYVPVVLHVGDASTTSGAVWIAVAGN